MINKICQPSRVHPVCVITNMNVDRIAWHKGKLTKFDNHIFINKKCNIWFSFHQDWEDERNWFRYDNVQNTRCTKWYTLSNYTRHLQYPITTTMCPIRAIIMPTDSQSEGRSLQKKLTKEKIKQCCKEVELSFW